LLLFVGANNDSVVTIPRGVLFLFISERTCEVSALLGASMLMSSIFSGANITIASGGGGGLFKVSMKYSTHLFTCSSSDVNTLPALLLMGLSILQTLTTS
jgi:hypothetical protein